jgi:hypothetical protein
MARATPTTEERLANRMRRWIWSRLEAGDPVVVGRLLHVASDFRTKPELCDAEREVVLRAAAWVGLFSTRYASRSQGRLPTVGNIASAIRHQITMRKLRTAK